MWGLLTLGMTYNSVIGIKVIDLHGCSYVLWFYLCFPDMNCLLDHSVVAVIKYIYFMYVQF